MAARKGGLGKGFEALMQSNTMDDELGEKATLSINDIEPNRGMVDLYTFCGKNFFTSATTCDVKFSLPSYIVRSTPSSSIDGL